MQVKSLTGFRAFAAGIVIIGHLIDYKNPNNYWLFKYGWVGVNFFFALSGFLFTILYLDKFQDKKQSFKEYFLKRIFRIYPLYLFLLFITILTQQKYSYGDIISHLTMTHAFFRDYRFSINAPMWTLSVEEFYYLLVPFILIFIGHSQSISYIKTKKGRLFLTALILLILHLAFTKFTFDFIDMDSCLAKFVNGMDIYDLELWSTTIFGRFSDFAFGMIAGYFVLKFPDSKLLKNNLISSSFFIFGLVVFYFASYWLEIHGGVKHANNEYYYQHIVRSYGFAGMLMIFSLYGNSIFRRIFQIKFIEYLGKISFALYLCQFVGIGPIDKLVLFFKNKAIIITYFYSESLSVIIAYVAISFIAALLYHFVELPCQTYLRNRYLKKIPA